VAFREVEEDQGCSWLEEKRYQLVVRDEEPGRRWTPEFRRWLAERDEESGIRN